MGKRDLDRLISCTCPLEQFNEAYQDMLGGEIARGEILLRRPKQRELGV